MTAEQQTLAAAVIVVLTLAIFLRRAFRRKGCACSGCGAAVRPVKGRANAAVPPRQS